MIFIVDWQPVGRRTEIDAGTTLLTAAQAAGVELVSICGGVGTCRGCRVRLAEGKLSPLTLEEQAVLDPEEITAGLRLACQATPLGDVRIDIPPESLTTPQRLQLEDTLGYGRDVPMERTDVPMERLCCGLALDIGTTKLAGYLVDLHDGKTLARAGAMNPQIGYGEDVVSRIVYANQHPDGRKVLQTRLVETLNQLIDELCFEAKMFPGQIEAAVAVGNTVMHHLFTGLPVQQLGVAPYAPARVDAMAYSAKEVGLALHPDTPVYLPPNIAGYVGADHVAVLTSLIASSSRIDPGREDGEVSEPDWRDIRGTLVIDIGTNTEVSLIRGTHIWSCSCASGPAFEGAHIRDGMRAASGAIERVQISGTELRVHTIGNQPAVGICGSGILDAVAQLLAAGAIDTTGNFRGSHPLVRSSRDGPRECLIVPAAQTGHGRDMIVTRKDINEIQLAKGAIRAGTEILLLESGVAASEIDEFVIAGAFGTYLDLDSAIRVGMFPDLPRDRFRQVGNAAGAGARLMLVSPQHRRLAERLARQVHYVELTTHPKFTEMFVKQIMF